MQIHSLYIQGFNIVYIQGFNSLYIQGFNIVYIQGFNIVYWILIGFSYILPFFITYNTNLCIGLIIYFLILSSFFTILFTFFSSYETFSPTLYSTLYVFDFLFFSHLFISEFSVDLHYKDDIPEIWNTLWVSTQVSSSQAKIDKNIANYFMETKANKCFM